MYNKRLTSLLNLRSNLLWGEANPIPEKLTQYGEVAALLELYREGSDLALKWLECLICREAQDICAPDIKELKQRVDSALFECFKRYKKAYRLQKEYYQLEQLSLN